MASDGFVAELTRQNFVGRIAIPTESPAALTFGHRPFFGQKKTRRPATGFRHEGSGRVQQKMAKKQCWLYSL